jgi:hypothetical protein
MSFKDPKEHESVLGPLFETEAKAAIPVFGQEKFISKNTKLVVDGTVKEALRSTSESVINLLAPPEPNLGQASNSMIIESLPDQLDQLSMSKNENIDTENGHNYVSVPTYSSRELHDKSHYTLVGIKGSTKSLGEQLENVLLRRAKKGYLFDCELNKSIVSDNHWLQDVWNWIKGNLMELLWDPKTNDAFRSSKSRG